MAKRFEKKNTDKKEIKKEEKKVGIGKAIAVGAGTLLSVGLFIITKGKQVAPKHKTLLPSAEGHTRKSNFQCSDDILLMGHFESWTPESRRILL